MAGMVDRELMVLTSRRTASRSTAPHHERREPTRRQVCLAGDCLHLTYDLRLRVDRCYTTWRDTIRDDLPQVAVGMAVRAIAKSVDRALAQVS
jgi:hypothetical protein